MVSIMTAERKNSQDYEEKSGCLAQLKMDEQSIECHLRHLFSRSLENSKQQVYLANHSLGRALDQTEQDVLEGLSYWYAGNDKAWEPWLHEIDAFRNRVARLINACRFDCIVPKTSAGQGLRTILNCYNKPLRVITSVDEFNSIDHILKVYAKKSCIDIQRVNTREDGSYHSDDFVVAMEKGADLLVVSLVMFTSGQLLDNLPRLIDIAHQKGIKVFVDLYHAAGVVPLNVTDMDIDFAVGGSYKYLHGGPGACWLYIHPKHLDGTLQSLDTGWFAQSNPFAFARPNTPELANSGDGFLESTPAILPFYQARAGLKFILAIGVEQLRQYSLQQQLFLEQRLTENNISFLGKAAERGAFISMPHRQADLIADKLEARNIICDAREGLLRFGPDLLNTETELILAVEKLVEIWKTV